MEIKDIQKLIDNKFQPNVAEWAMDVEDVLDEANMMSDEAQKCLKQVKQQPLSWHQSFPEKSDTLVAMLKRIVKNMQSSVSIDIQKGENLMSQYEYDIFISYAHANDNYATELRKSFDKLCIKIFRDTENIEWGDKWEEVIENALKKCRFGVVIISEDFYNRDWTEKELKTLLMRQNVLPILYNTDFDNLKSHCKKSCYKDLAKIQFIKASEYDVKDITILLARKLLNY